MSDEEVQHALAVLQKALKTDKRSFPTTVIDLIRERDELRKSYGDLEANRKTIIQRCDELKAENKKAWERSDMHYQSYLAMFKKWEELKAEVNQHGRDLDELKYVRGKLIDVMEDIKDVLDKT